MTAPEAIAAEPALEVRHLSRRFGGLWALRDVSFAVAEKEILGVIGPNGAGKSTLVNLVTGHLRPTGGQVMVGGKDVTGMRPWSIAHDGVARTFQIVKPFRGLTVRENVAIGAMHGNEGDPSVHEALESADRILELIHRLRDSGITIVAVEHVIRAIVSVSDRILVLHHGSILAMGSPRDVLSDERVIEAYLGHRYLKRGSG